MVHGQKLTFVIMFSAASLLTHIGATAWAAFQIVHTADFHRQFTRLTTEGACGVNLLPTYWKERANAEIPGLALNAVALLISAFLSWRLIKVQLTLGFVLLLFSGH